MGTQYRKMYTNLRNPQTQRGEAQEGERTEGVTLVVLMLPRGSLSVG